MIFSKPALLHRTLFLAFHNSGEIHFWRTGFRRFIIPFGMRHLSGGITLSKLAPRWLLHQRTREHEADLGEAIGAGQG